MKTDETTQANESNEGQRVLISGASFAGVTTAIWMQRLGYRVTVVELAAGPRTGGTPVDLHEDSIAIAKRIGVFEAIMEKVLPPRATEFAEIDGTPIPRGGGDDAKAYGGVVEDYEIHREDLLAILFAALGDSVEVIYKNSISALVDIADGVRVSFREGPDRDFAMVLGCDGNHSNVRALRFGPESEYSHFLHNYFSVAVVDGVFITPSTTRIQNTPGRTVMLNSYEDATDIVLAFHADDEIEYDYHDVDEQKRLLRKHFADADKPLADLVDRALDADNFYFDKLSQIRMPLWTSGRVALVGDAGYCPSPAAGMGGSIAIRGATALYDAFLDADGDIDSAFAGYERNFHATADRIQAETEAFGVPMIFPDTVEAISARNAQLLDY